MATIYVSYTTKDYEVVKPLVGFLEGKGHKLRWDQEVYIGAAWREELTACEGNPRGRW